MTNFLEQIRHEAIATVADWGFSKVLIVVVSACLVLGLARARRCLSNWWLRRILGRDASRNHVYAVVFSSLKLPNARDNQGKLVQHVYIKDGATRDGKQYRFSIENPVSGSEVRAINYVSSMFGRAKLSPPELENDKEVDKLHDASFIALGGPGSNNKTWDALRNAANTLIDFDGVRLVNKQSNEEIAHADRYDYGLILRIQPGERNERTWIVCAGISEWGTSGAAWYLAGEWQQIQRKILWWHHPFAFTKSFAIVVRVESGKDDSAKLVYLITSDGKVVDERGRDHNIPNAAASATTVAASGCSPSGVI